MLRRRTASLHARAKQHQIDHKKRFPGYKSLVHTQEQPLIENMDWDGEIVQLEVGCFDICSSKQYLSHAQSIIPGSEPECVLLGVAWSAPYACVKIKILN